MRLFSRFSTATVAILCFFSSLPAQAASNRGWFDFTITSPLAAMLSSPRGSSVFTSTEFGFSIQYPQGWDKLEPPEEGILLLLQSFDGNAAFAINGSNELEDPKLSNLTPKSVEENLASLGVRIRKQVRLKLYDPEFAGKAFLGTQPADDGSILRSKYVFIVREKTLLVFSFASTPEVFVKSVRSFDKIVASLSAQY